jgi:hypothetical protein
MSFDLPICFQYFVYSCVLFAHAILCFQHITDSFAKNTGAGGYHSGGMNPSLGVNFSNSALKQTAEGFSRGGVFKCANFSLLINGALTTLPPPHRRTIRSQCSRTHTKSGRKRWWDIPQKISATRAAPFMRSSRCGIRAQPMAPRFAQLVDALNRESRQILHRCLRNCVSLEPVHLVSIRNSCLTELT